MLSENYKWNIINSFFKKKGFVSHQTDTFNDFLNNGIQSVVNEVDINIDQSDQDYKYSISFGQYKWKDTAIFAIFILIFVAIN